MTKAEKAAYDRRRYQENRDRLLQHSKDYHRERYAKDPVFRERKNARDRAWKASVFGKQWCAAYSATRRQRETGDFTVEDRIWVLELFNYRCIRCNSTENLEVDHLNPLCKGYPLARDNAIVLCKACNRKKYSKMPSEFFTEEELERIHEVQGQEL